MLSSATHQCIRKVAAIRNDMQKSIKDEVAGAGNTASADSSLMGYDRNPASWTDDQVATRAAYNFYRSSGVGKLPAWNILRRNKDYAAHPLTKGFKATDYMSPEQLLYTARRASIGAPGLEDAVGNAQRGQIGSQLMETLKDPGHNATLKASYTMRATPQGRDLHKRYNDFNQLRLRAQLRKSNPNITDAQLNRAVSGLSGEHTTAFIDSLVNLGKSIKPDGTLDEQYNAARDTMLGDIAAAERVEQAGDTPSEADMDHMSAVSADPARKAVLARAMHASNIGQKSPSSFYWNGKAVNIDAPAYEEVEADLNKRLEAVPFYMKNKDTIGAMSEFRKSPIMFLLSTLFTSPRKFFSVINALNASRQRGSEWNRFIGNKTEQVASYLPWLNLLNNLAGSVVGSQDNKFQYWG